MKNKLIDGKIPAFTFCPFKEKCEIWELNNCLHLGNKHPCTFFCAVARTFEIIEKDEGEYDEN